MVYDRNHEEKTLSFEPSGALLQAALLMRDRETDSWWSIMAGKAIGGELEGVPLPELPFSTKTTWREWRRSHPGTLVLKIGDRTYAEENHYEKYFASEKTSRGIEPEDDRLKPKTPIFAFRVGDEPVAVTHHRIEGGYAFSTDPERLMETRVFLYRSAGASIFESTRAYRVPKKYLAFIMESAKQLLDRIDGAIHAGRAEKEGVEVFPGVDTYWYTWVAQNPETRVVQ